MAAPRRRRRWVFVLSSLLGLLAVAWLARGPLLAPIVRARLAEALSQALGGLVTIDQAGGGWWGDAWVAGVHGPDLQATNLKALAIDRLDARWEPRLLWTRDREALLGVSASGIQATFTVQGDGPGAGTWTPILDLVPHPLPSLDLHGALHLRTRVGDFSCSDVGLRGGSGTFTALIHEATVSWWPEAVTALVRLTRPERSHVQAMTPFRLGPLWVTSLDLRLGSVAPSVEFTAEVAGGTLVARIAPGTVEAKAHGLDLARMPAPILAWIPRGLRPRQGSLDIEVTTGTNDLHLDVIWRQLSFGPMLASEGHLALDWNDDLVVCDLQAGLPGIDIDATQVTLDRSQDWMPIMGSVRFRAKDLRTILPLIRLPSQWWPATPLAVEGDIELDQGFWRIGEARLRFTGLDVQATGSWRQSDGSTNLNASWIADLGDLTTSLPIIRDSSGILTGTTSFAGTAKPDGQLPVGDLRLEIAGDDLLLAGTPCDHLRLHLTPVRAGPVAIEAVTSAFGLDTTFLGHIERTEEEWRLHLRQGSLEWRGLQVALADPTVIRIRPDQVAFEDTSLSLLGGSLRLTGMAGKNLALACAATNIDLGQLAVLGGSFTDLSGHADLSLVAEGPTSLPMARLEAHASTLTWGDISGDLDVIVSQNGQGLQVQRLDAVLGNRFSFHGSGSWPMTVGRDGINRFPGSGSITATCDLDLTRFAPPGTLATGFLGITASVTGDAQQPAFVCNLRLADFQPIVTPSPLPTSTPPPPAPTLNGRLTVTATSTSAKADGSLTIDGIEAVRLSASAGDGALPLKDWPITGDLVVPGFDLAALAGLHQSIQRLLGSLDGRLALGGTPADPRVQGNLLLRDGECKLRRDVPTIAAATGTLRVDGLRLTLDDLTAEMGYAPIHVNGSVDLGPDPDITLDFRTKNALVLQRSDLTARIDTDDLRLSGRLSALTATGTLKVTDCLYSRSITWFQKGRAIADDRFQLFAIEAPPFDRMRFSDLHIITEGDGLRIANNLVRAQCEVDLVLGGTGAVPEPTGRVTTREATVTLPLSVLTIDRAELTFAAEDPFRPRLEATGWSQIRQWRISLTTSGTINEPVISATAPGLSEDDALLLLTVGSTRNELESPEGQRSALTRVGSYLGAELVRLLRGPADPDADETILDRWTLEVGREVSEAGRDTIDAEIRLNKNEHRTGFYLYGQRDRYDDFNLGVILRFRFGGSDP